MQLPWLQRLGPPGLTVAPIVTRVGPDEAIAESVGEALAGVVRRAGEPVLLVASSDFSHHAPEARAAREDTQLIETIEALDVAAFCRGVTDLRASVCGAGAIAAVMAAARRLGAARGTLIQYGTSAQTGGDPDSATGYAGIVVN